MKRLLWMLPLAVVMLSAIVSAQNTSTTQMQLVNSPVFTNRLQYLMTQRAAVVLFEAATHDNANNNLDYDAACHTKRANYAVYVIGNPAGAASVAAVLVSGANYSGAVIVGTVTGSGSTADSSATDTAIDVALQNQWNTLSKCVTTP